MTALARPVPAIETGPVSGSPATDARTHFRTGTFPALTNRKPSDRAGKKAKIPRCRFDMANDGTQMT